MLVNSKSCLSAESVTNPTQAKVGEEMTKRGIADRLAESSVKRRSSSQCTRRGGEPPVPGTQVPGGLLPSLPKTWLWTKLELVKEEAQSADCFSFGTREKSGGQAGETWAHSPPWEGLGRRMVCLVKHPHFLFALLHFLGAPFPISSHPLLVCPRRLFCIRFIGCMQKLYFPFKKKDVCPDDITQMPVCLKSY